MHRLRDIPAGLTPHWVYRTCHAGLWKNCIRMARLSINIFRLRISTFMYDGEHLDIVRLYLVNNAVSVDRDLSHVWITELGRHLADTGQFFEDGDFGVDLLGNSFSLGR